MAERRQGEYWTDMGSESNPRSIKDRARWHQGRRERAVASILLELHLMASAGVISKNFRNLALKKASLENTFAYSGAETMEVHCTPRQLLINTIQPHELLARHFPERAGALRGFFERTDSLPISFNICDSLCEQFGVVEGFRAACVSAVASGCESGGELKFSNVIVAVKQAFGQYKAREQFAFSTCIDRLDKKLTFPKPLPDNEQKWKEQLLIIQNYSLELRNSTAVNSVTRIGEVEKLIRIYEGIR